MCGAMRNLRPLPVSIVLAAAAVAALVCGRPTAARAGEPLPPVPFVIDHSLSDRNRAVRPWEAEQHYRGPIFDTHVHLALPDAGVVPAFMEHAHVRRIIVMEAPATGFKSHAATQLYATLMDLPERSNGKIKVLCAVNDLGSWTMQAAYANRMPSPDEIKSHMDHLADELKSDRCSGVGELGFRHYDHGVGDVVISLPAGYPPLLAIAETVAASGKVLDIHAEPGEPNGARHEEEVFGTVAAMFQRAPNLHLILSHTGMTNAHNARALLAAYPNLMMNVNFSTHTAGKLDWEYLEPLTRADNRLYADWADLFEEFSDRFMVGTDLFFAARGYDAEMYRKNIVSIRMKLGSLKPEVARLIAFGNAKRLFDHEAGDHQRGERDDD